PLGPGGRVLVESQVGMLEQIGIHLAIQRTRAAQPARTAPCLPDPDISDAMTRILQPVVHVGLHFRREIARFSADDPLRSPLLDVSRSRHGASCASALE